jgi:rod shape-determining protein MreC
MTWRTVLWTLTMVVVSALLILLSRIGLLAPVENAALFVVSPAQRALTTAIRPADDFFDNIGEADDLREETERLRIENQRLAAEVARLREGETRLEELRELLQVKETQPEEEFLAANIFAREPSNLKEMVAIDRGKQDGVKEEMVVLTEGGTLVGTVTKALDDYSWVTLITDPNSAVSAMVQDSRAQGVVAGSYSRRLTMAFLRQAERVEEGDTVITSGVGGGFPPGLVIGTVASLENVRQELFKDVTVEPLARFRQLETVLVLTSFSPRHLEAP